MDAGVVGDSGGELRGDGTADCVDAGYGGACGDGECDDLYDLSYGNGGSGGDDEVAWKCECGGELYVFDQYGGVAVGACDGAVLA